MSDNNDIIGWNVTIPGKDIRKLNRNDLVIIQSLIENSRTSLPTLQKLTKLSKSSVINRIKNLEKEKTISGSSALINIHKLGFKSYSIGIKTDMSIIQKEKYVEFVKNILGINQILTFNGGRWDFLVRAYTINSEQLDAIITNLTSFEKILDLDIRLMDNWFYKVPDYTGYKNDIDKINIVEKSSFRKQFSESRNNRITFDKMDIEILKIISNNSRLKLSQIGRKLNLSKDTIRYRIKKLIKANIINSFFINVNTYHLNLIPYQLNMKVFNRTDIMKIINFINNNLRCTGMMKFEDSWNLSGIILINNVKELKEFEKLLLSRFEDKIKRHEFIQISEQPYFEMFPKDIADQIIKSLD